MTNEFNNLYEFAEFRFDGRKGKLWQNDALILLSPKASELLALLLERNGEFVSKEEIFEKVWTDTFVEDGVLTQNIYTLRKVLGKDADGQQIIENKTRLGYRITIPINKIEQTNGNLLENSDAPQNDANDEKVLPIPIEKPNRIRKKTALLLAVLLIVLLPAAFFAYRYFRPNIAAFFRKPIEKVRFSQLTSTGDLTNAVISPDGTLLAFHRGDSVFLKDILTEKEIKLEIPNIKSFDSLKFSPDGNFIYFRNGVTTGARAEIFKASRFGGEPQSVVEKAWGSFSLSPDGKKIAYFLNVPPIAKFNLHVKNLETGEEKEFLAAEQPENPCAVCSPAWSPDSRKILYTVNIPPTAGQLFVLNLENGEKEQIKTDKLRRFEQAAWLPDGDSFIVSATEGGQYFHLWKIFYPDGEVQPLTNGLASYGKVSISSDGKKILTLRADENSNLFIADAENLRNERQITFGNQNNFGQNGLHWVDQQRILYSTQIEQNLADNLTILNIYDNSKISIPAEKQNAFRIPVSDGKQIWFTMSVNGVSQVFQMDLNGKNVRQLTDGNDGQRHSPRVTNDSKYLYYVLRGKEESSILRFDLQNRKEEVFFSNPDFQPGAFLELSPDNKYLTFSRTPQSSSDKSGGSMTVVSIENTTDIKVFSASIVPTIRRFSPDNQSLDYIYAVTDSTQIVRQKFDGSAPQPIYTISEGKIFNFAWSKDGKKIVISRGQQSRDAVLLSEFE